MPKIQRISHLTISEDDLGEVNELLEEGDRTFKPMTLADFCAVGERLEIYCVRGKSNRMQGIITLSIQKTLRGKTSVRVEDFVVSIYCEPKTHTSLLGWATKRAQLIGAHSISFTNRKGATAQNRHYQNLLGFTIIPKYLFEQRFDGT